MPPSAQRVDTLVANRQSLNIKVMNLSIGIEGTPGLDASLRQKINSAVGNGIVMCCSAGNDGTETTGSQPGSRQVDDPGRAALAITVGASNCINQLTDYSSWGFPSPGASAGQQEDYKPDILAPRRLLLLLHDPFRRQQYLRRRKRVVHRT